MDLKSTVYSCCQIVRNVDTYITNEITLVIHYESQPNSKWQQTPSKMPSGCTFSKLHLPQDKIVVAYCNFPFKLASGQLSQFSRYNKSCPKNAIKNETQSLCWRIPSITSLEIGPLSCFKT